MALEAKAGAERIRKIVRGLKTFSRAEEERRSVLDVVPLLELSVNMMFNEMRHRGRLVKDYGKVPLVEADDARLGQVFINLLVNSAQALPEGDCSANEIRIVTSTDAAGRAVIEVADTGVGIPEQLLERIFDPFFTTKPVGVGTGLGLSICHTIVTSMGGELTVASRVGSGTTFRVVLPAAAPAQVATAAVDSQRPVLACGAVLVVDDEPAIGNVLRRVLRDHEVTTLTSAKEALALLRAGQHFDIIFSDLMMPEMTGMELHRAVRTWAPDVADRFVFLTGGAYTDGAREFLAGVENPKLDKPIQPNLLRSVVTGVLRGSYA